jgi:mRNA-degrading endonuclease toxin of MazEF toxin-antitoxin module
LGRQGAAALKRGDLFLVRQGGTPAAKARPCVIIQRDSTLPSAAKITCCPLTTELRGPLGGRPQVFPSALNGLEKPSEIEFDWIYTFPLNQFLKRIGELEPPIMDQLILALRRWLDL